MITAVCLTILSAYLIGSFPTAYIAGRLLRQIDIRDHGSGNMGATNCFRVLGKGPGVCVLVLDIIKGMLAVAFVPSVFFADVSLNIAMVAGITAIAGHNWTVFLQFRGGKGIATSLGVLIGLCWVVPGLWLVLVTVLSVFLIVLLSTRYVSLGSLCAGVCFPFMTVVMGHPWPLIVFAVLLAVFVVLRHRPNIQRLRQGTESKIPVFWKKN